MRTVISLIFVSLILAGCGKPCDQLCIVNKIYAQYETCMRNTDRTEVITFNDREYADTVVDPDLAIVCQEALAQNLNELKPGEGK